MHLKRYSYAADYTGGTYANVALDTTLNVSTYNHPALVPNINTTPGTAQTGAAIRGGTSTPVATLSGSNQFALVDTILITPNGGDYFTFVTTAPVVQINFTGVLSSGMVHAGAPGVVSNAIRNGCLAQVLVDGIVQATVDLYAAAPSVSLTLDGNSHTIKVLHTGQFDTSVNPVSSVKALVGTTVAAGLSLTASTTQRTLVPASWRVLATASGTYSLYKTPQGSTESLIVSGLTTGTTYDLSSRVPGVSFVLTGTLTTNDSATFTTDQVMMGVLSFILSTGSGGNYGTYTSPVLQTTAANTQFFLAEFSASDLVQGHVNGVSGYVSPSFVLLSGNTPTPDPTWQSTTATLVDQVRSDGTRLGMYSAGIQSPRGQYAQWAFTFPLGLTTVPWVRDFNLYYWVPETDPQFLAKVAVGTNWIPGPTMNAFYGTLAVLLRSVRQNVLDYINSYTISGAVDQYLQAIGADLGVPTYNGESPSAYRIRLQAALGSRPQGGSATFIAQQAAELIGGVAATTTSAFSGTLQTVTATSSKLTTGTVSVAQTAVWAANVTIPAGTTGSSGSVIAWPGLPGVSAGQGGLGRAIVNALLATLTPIGAKLTVKFMPDGNAS